MPREELGRLLKDLAAQLEDTDALDGADRAALERLRQRIGSKLADETDETDETDEADAAPEGPAETIAEMVDRFENSHPTLTMTLGRIMDALNKLGI